MRATSRHRARRTGAVMVLTLAASAPFWIAPAISAQEQTPAVVVELDETVISGNQELPKVLYILPWREPAGLPQIELETEFTELEVFRRLYPPAYRRELGYFETLEGTSSEE